MIAASIASAAVLCIEPDKPSIQQCTRDGISDFAVNTLDEALRALKNEVRKGLSVAICLEGDPERWLPEMVERGVQPDVLCAGQTWQAGELDVFRKRGARMLDRVQPDDEALVYTSWRVSEMPGKWLGLIDEEVAQELPIKDRCRRAWLQRAPRYMGRLMRTEHGVFLSRSESGDLLNRLRSQVESRRLDVTVTVTQGSTSLVFERP